MRKAFKFKLFRNKKKFSKLERELKVFCNIYNHCITLHKRYYRMFGKSLHRFTLNKHLKKLRDRGFKPSWKELGYAQAVEQLTDRIEKSYSEFFKWCKKRTGPRKSPPKFKPWRKYKSFTLRQSSWKVDEEKGIVTIGKNNYRYNNCRNIEGRVKTVTVKRDEVGDWYVIFSCDLGENYKSQEIAPVTGESAGFDFGLQCFLTSSEGEQIQSPEFLKRSLGELKKKSRKLSSKRKGSKNRAKAKKVVARLHRKIANQRADFHFKLAKDLINRYDYLFFEDLNLSGMQKLWGRKVADLALYDFMLKIKFKAAEHGKIVILVPRFYPSSKTCSSCLKVKEELSLKERTFKCSCGHEMNRDLNAAINILSVGVSTLGLDGVRPA